MSHSLTMDHRDSYWFFLLSLSSSRSILHPFNPSALRHFCSLRPIPIPIRNKPLHHSYNYIVQSPTIPTINIRNYTLPAYQLGKNVIILLCSSRINSYSLPLYHVNHVISRKVPYLFLLFIHELQCTKLIQ